MHPDTEHLITTLNQSTVPSFHSYVQEAFVPFGLLASSSLVLLSCPLGSVPAENPAAPATRATATLTTAFSTTSTMVFLRLRVRFSITLDAVHMEDTFVISLM